MVELYLINLNHDGSTISTYKVVQPSYSFNIKDMGDCAWDLPLSSIDLAGFPIGENEFAPKASDYMLIGTEDQLSSFSEIQAGRLLTVNLKADSGVIKCSGKDWLEYLDQPFPFDYSLTPETISDASENIYRLYTSTAGADTTNTKFNSTQQSVIENIVGEASALSDLAYGLDFVGGGWTELVTPMAIQYWDERSMLDIIREIGSLNDPFGFDFWVTWDKVIHLYSPRLLIDPESVSTIADLFWGDDIVVDADWTNNGPKASDTVGKSPFGFWALSTYPPTAEDFRKTLQFIQLSERFRSSDMTAAGAGAQGQLDRNPQKDLVLTVLPSALIAGNELSGYFNLVGQAISFNSSDLFMPYHQIDATYMIVSQNFKSDEVGNYVCDLGLQQLYPLT